MIELTKLDVQKMASDLLKVSVDSVSIELKSIMCNGVNILGDGLARPPFLLKGGDMTIYYIVGGNAFSGARTFNSGIRGAMVEWNMRGIPVPSTLLEVCRGGFFCDSLSLHLNIVPLPFCLVYYRISVK